MFLVAVWLALLSLMLKQRLETLREDNRWILARDSYLRKKYPDMFVAIRGKRVVASSPEMDEIIEKLKEKSIDPKTVVIDYISKEPVKLLL